MLCTVAAWCLYYRDYDHPATATRITVRSLARRSLPDRTRSPGIAPLPRPRFDRGSRMLNPSARIR